MLNFIKASSSLFFVSTFLLMQGCATQSVKLTPQERDKLADLSSIKVVHQQTGWPTLKTPMGVVASELTLGLSEDWSAGQKLVHKFGVSDPAKSVKEKFLNQVNTGRSVANFKNDTQPLGYEERSIEKMQQKYGSGVVLKFNTFWWQIWYYPMNWARYQMWFQTEAQLVRLDDSKVLWKSICKANQSNSETAPTLDELTADNSVVLQTWVDNATSECSQQLIDDFMGQVS